MSETPIPLVLSNNSSGRISGLSSPKNHHKQSGSNGHQPRLDLSSTSLMRSPEVTPSQQFSDPYEPVYPGIMHNPLTGAVCVSVLNFDQHSYTVSFNSPRTMQAMSQLGLKPSEQLSVPLTSFEEKQLADPNAVSVASLLVLSNVNSKSVGIKDKSRMSSTVNSLKSSSTNNGKKARTKHSIEQKQKVDSLRLQAKIQFERFETLRLREQSAVKKQRLQIIKENQHKNAIRHQANEDRAAVEHVKRVIPQKPSKSKSDSGSNLLSKQRSRRHKEAMLARESSNNEVEGSDLLVTLDKKIQSLRAQELGRQDMVLQIQRDKLALHVRGEIRKCKLQKEGRRRQISDIKRVEMDCVYVWESIVKKKQEHKLRLRNMNVGFAQWKAECEAEFEEERSNARVRAAEDGRPFEGVMTVPYEYGTASYEEARARGKTGVVIQKEMPIQPVAPKQFKDAEIAVESEDVLAEEYVEDAEIRVNDGENTDFTEYTELNRAASLRREHSLNSLSDNFEEDNEMVDYEDEFNDENSKLERINRERRQSQILFDFDLNDDEENQQEQQDNEGYNNDDANDGDEQRNNQDPDAGGMDLLTFDEGVILGSRRRVVSLTTDPASVQNVGEELFGFVARANATAEDNQGPLLTICNIAQKAYSQLVLQLQALERHQRAEVSRQQYSFAAERQQQHSEQQRTRSLWEDERRQFQRYTAQQDKRIVGQIRQIKQHERLMKVLRTHNTLKQQRQEHLVERLRNVEERQQQKQQEEVLGVEAKQLKQELKRMQIADVHEREAAQRLDRLEWLKERERHTIEKAQLHAEQKKAVITERNRQHAVREKRAKQERARLDDEKRQAQVEIAERLRQAEERCQVLLGEREDELKAKRQQQILYTQDRQLHMVRAKRITMYRAELAEKKRLQDDERLRRAQLKKADWAKEREALHKRGLELMNTAHSRLDKLISTDVSNIARLDPAVADELALMILPPIQYQPASSSTPSRRKPTTVRVPTIHESPNDE